MRVVFGGLFLCLLLLNLCFMFNILLEWDQFWFYFILFQIEFGEDVEINLGCYGRVFVRWVVVVFQVDGVVVDEVFFEDWGWCVMVKKWLFCLWVGCGNVIDYEGF